MSFDSSMVTESCLLTIKFNVKHPTIDVGCDDGLELLEINIEAIIVKLLHANASILYEARHFWMLDEFVHTCNLLKDRHSVQFFVFVFRQRSA
jgi:hypothetical protein